MTLRKSVNRELNQATDLVNEAVDTIKKSNGCFLANDRAGNIETLFSGAGELSPEFSIEKRLSLLCVEEDSLEGVTKLLNLIDAATNNFKNNKDGFSVENGLYKVDELKNSHNRVVFDFEDENFGKLQARITLVSFLDFDSWSWQTSSLLDPIEFTIDGESSLNDDFSNHELVDYIEDHFIEMATKVASCCAIFPENVSEEELAQAHSTLKRFKKLTDLAETFF